MKKEEISEVITDLQKALSKALNSEVIREYEHLQARAEEVVKNLSNEEGRSEQLPPCKHIKRTGESCTLNNKCTYPNCE